MSDKKVLVLNSGSSSLKYRVFSYDQEELADGLVERIGLGQSIFRHTKFCKDGDKEKKQIIDLANHEEAMTEVVKLLQDKELGCIHDPSEIVCVGHRFVQGLDTFNEPALLTTETLKQLESYAPLAPLHQPAHMSGANTAIKLFPKASQVAVCDTAFHSTIPDYAYRYAIPKKYYEEEHIRAYGFHGTSHLFITKEIAKVLGKKKEEVSFINLHLGNGASMCCVKDGKSIDTSMGLSPLDGLMMGSRCGQIDPTVLLYMGEKMKMDSAEINQLLNKGSGLKGVGGSMDLRDVIKSADSGNKEAKLAIEIYCYKIKKFVGAYMALLPKIDALTFTAGVGENASIIREKSLANLEHFGIIIDTKENNIRKPGNRKISTPESKIPVYIIPTNEELEICEQTKFVHEKSQQ